MQINKLIEHVTRSVSLSYQDKSNIDLSILKIDGMSSRKVRHLINNLCSLRDSSYFEVGSWKGSTLCSSLSNNNLNSVICCENFSEFTGSDHTKGGPSIKNELLKNIEEYRGNNNVNIIEDDFFSKKWDNSQKYNIYMYDGMHTFQSQYYQVAVAKQFLDKYSIMIVDDWFCEVSRPREATIKALNDFRFYVHTYIELPAGQKDAYWNGLGLFIIQNN